MAERKRLRLDGLENLGSWENLCRRSDEYEKNYPPLALLKKFRAIHLIAMSFCGVLTPPYVYLDENDEKSFRLSQRDLLGVELLRKNNFRVMVLSNRRSVVEHRCHKMGIECFTADRVEEAKGKDGLLRHILYGNDIFESQVMYIGDEINDLRVMELAGVSIATRDAHRSVREVADYVTTARGGDHAVREVAELLLLANDHKLEL